MRSLCAVLAALCLGCTSGSRYTDGAMLQLGAYIPMSGEVVGIEVLNYLSGTAVKAGTNQAFTVTRSYSATNDYFGLVHVRERVDTTVSVERPK